MSMQTIPTQYARERTSSIFDVPLDDSDGQDIEAGELSSGVVTLSATYGRGREWHVNIPVEVGPLAGVS